MIGTNEKPGIRLPVTRMSKVASNQAAELMVHCVIAHDFVLAYRIW